MEGELIYVAIIMQVGTLITILLWSNLSLSKYFKKENFKIDKSNVMAQNKLQLRKLEREMGLSKSKDIVPTTETPNTLSTLTSLAPLLAKLEPDQIMSLADRFLGGGEAPAEGGSGLGGILDSIPPELIDGFLKGLANKEGAPDAQEPSGFQPQA